MRRYVVGIDLGTTNTVVAYTEAGADEIRLFEVEQLVSPGQVAASPLLPSVRYHPAAGELSAGDIRLPWVAPDVAGLNPVVMGSLARDLGAQVPGRLVASAKSWLSHASVDRAAPILPWGAGDDVSKVSPVAASASYLAYVRAAWNHQFPQAPLEHQEVVLTVPASFDEGARALTVQAARLAQLPELRLVEEPQAAFYDWLFRHRGSLEAELQHTRLVLVCDVGGGTTDLTLIQVEMQRGEPQLTRIGVGDHLMLGGDNMDLALAHLVETRMALAETRLSASRLSQLIQRCRAAKELLLGSRAPDKTPVTLLGGGAKLVGAARSVELTRQEVEQVVVDGFFPLAAPDEPSRRRRAGIVEFGLSYAADPAITRHVAAFLCQHAAASRLALGSHAPGEPALPVPDTLLLNGGVFRAHAIARRLENTLATWRGDPLQLLHNDDPDVAVARGAVAYALARHGRAPKIGGGSARSYFLILEDGEPSRRGICVLPRGTEEGQEIRIESRTFALRLGQPVRFHLASSVADTAHEPGALTDLGAGNYLRLPPLATVVQPGAASAAREIPVQLITSLTETGTLELHCVSTENPAQRWRLEFQVRGEDREEAAPTSSKAHPQFAKALEKIEAVFGARSQQVGTKEVTRLRWELERLLGDRDGWDTLLLRELFGALWERARRRRRSADHERLWLNLTGFCLRPGFGYPLDEWRVEQLWSLFGQGIQYVNESRMWSEWWTLWRRVAGGLTAEQQTHILDALAPCLQADAPRPKKGSYDDIVRLLASLERIPAERKVDIGESLLSRLHKPGESLQSWWALGRIGARKPFYGSTHNTVPAEVATRWLDRILALDWQAAEMPAFAATQMARMTGDRSRDVAPEVRAGVASRLKAVKAPRSWIAMVREFTDLDEADERRVFGESLPPGLKLLK